MHSQVATESSKFSGLGDPISLQFRSSDALLRNLTRLVKNVISELLILIYFFHLIHFTVHSFGKQALLPVSLYSRSPSETGHFSLVTDIYLKPIIPLCLNQRQTIPGFRD